MLQNDNSPQTNATGTTELSPVKRALVEIRHLRAELERSKRETHLPIAIVGMAMRLPGGVNSPERFWEALAAGEDLIGTVPASRWDARAFLSADPDHPGTMYDAHGGFLDDVDAFDAEFFGINPREAASMDPQQRFLLELTWEALERAGIDPKSLFNTSAGVFLGLSNCDYARFTMNDAREIDAYAGVGASLSIAAGRISYFLGTHGPAIIVDTACSSSLIALHLAVQSLRRGEIDLAVVGGANLILSPEFNVAFSRTRMLSRDGHSRTFDASADGYVRSEGCGVVILRRLPDAEKEGQPVLAIVAGSAVNQDGRSAGITAPNGPAQEAVIRAALADARIAPASVSFVETHGTGTPLGDPIEAQALAAVYGEGRDGGSPLHIGSVKSNLGHTEAAAGITGLMKLVLMMQPGHTIVPHPHFREPNPRIDWEHLPLQVATKPAAWQRGEKVFAGLSSFGFSGTNAHIVLASPESTGDAPAQAIAEECLLVLSAAHPTALQDLAERYVVFLRETNARFIDICFTALNGRSSLGHRLAVRARDSQSAAAMLERWLGGAAVEGLAANDPAGQSARPAEDGLGRLQSACVEGAKISWQEMSSVADARRVSLPVYPFRRTRHWFGPAPEQKRRHESEQSWQAAANAAERQSKQGPVGWQIGDYEERWQALHRLTLAHAHNVLANAGAFRNAGVASVDQVMEQCGFQAIYRNLVSRWLEGLASTGSLIAQDGGFRACGDFSPINPDRYWHEAEQQLADNPGVLAYLRQCSAHLGDVLQGRTSALETLFPEGSFALAEGVYETTPEARYLNPIVAAAVSEATRSIGKRRNARVLEVGGGTGGTTSAILPALFADTVEYWFTDLSDLFLNRAARKFAAYPFMQYAIFDLDRELSEQVPGSVQFDVIVGANVVHASRNLKTALERVQQLLAPGGLMVLLESTRHHSWFDMTTGLIEGWQHFEDELRGAHPLLPPERWKEVLEHSGFSPVLTLPSADSPLSQIGQHVIVARSNVDSGQSASPELTSPAQAWQPREASPMEAAQPEMAAQLSRMTPEQREEAVARFVRTTIRRVFNLAQSAEELTARDRLSDLGMDSLIALELRAELAKGLGLGSRISSTIAFDTGTVGELTRALLRVLEEDGAGSAPATGEAAVSEEAPTGNGHAGDAETLSSTALLTVDELSAMSEEEVERLLNERLAKS